MRTRLPWILTGLFALTLAIYGPLRVANLAGKGRQPLIKWQPAFEALAAGKSPYSPADAAGEGEGFPGPPFAALVLRPFLAFGEVGGSLAFAAVKLALILWMLRACMALARAPGEAQAVELDALTAPPVPPWAWTLLIALAFRVLLSDVVHGNTNVLVAATIVAAAVAWRARLDALSGLLIGIGVALKLTPLIFVVFFLAKRSRDGLLGLFSGLLLFGLALPGATLGFAWHLELLGDYWSQMVAPFATLQGPGPMQANQLNQSLTGVATRLLTDQPAIEPRAGVWPDGHAVTLLRLQGNQVLWIVRALSLVLVAIAAWACSRSADRTRTGLEFGALAMVMLLVSERSWKHHYVPVVLPLAALAWLALSTTGPARRNAAIGLGAWALCAGATGSGILGDRGSDLAEAYGAFVIGALVLFAVSCRALLREPDAPAVAARSA